MLLTTICEKPEHQFITLNLVSKYEIPRRLNYIRRRFGTLCLFHLHTYPLWRWGRQSVPKRRNVKLKSRGIIYANISEHSVCSIFIPNPLWRWSRQSVPKRRNIKLKSRGITQKKAYNFQKRAKVWNQANISHFTPFVDRNLNRVRSKCHELSVRQICTFPTPQSIIAMTCTFSLLEYDFYLNNTGWFKRKCQYRSLWET